MKIAIITLNPPETAGGVERFTFHLKQILLEAGFEVKVFDKSLLGKDYKGFLWDWRRLGSYRAAFEVGRLFSREAKLYDLVMCDGISGWNVKFSPAINVYHGNIAAYAEAIRKGVSFSTYLKTRYLDTLFCRLSGRGKIIVSVSRSTAEEVKKYYKLKSHTIIESAVNTELFKPREEKLQLRNKFGLPNHCFLGLLTARITYGKGIDILQEIASKLKGDTFLVTTLSGSDKNLNLDKIICLHNVSCDDMPLLYSACDFFIFPSRYEGCSRSLVEAMASGLPIIISQAGHAEEISEKEPKLGEFILEDLEPNLFLEKINQLKSGPQLCSKIGERARKYVLENNSLETFRKKWLGLVSSLLNTSLPIGRKNE
jgi:glycosyltransferase involved in cell wall biosynthesis